MHVTGIAIVHGIFELLVLGVLLIALVGIYAMTRQRALSRPDQAKKLGSLAGMLGIVIMLLFVGAIVGDELLIDLGVLTQPTQASILRLARPVTIVTAAVELVLVCASIVLLVWAEVMVRNRPPRSTPSQSTNEER